MFWTTVPLANMCKAWNGLQWSCLRAVPLSPLCGLYLGPCHSSPRLRGLKLVLSIVEGIVNNVTSKRLTRRDMLPFLLRTEFAVQQYRAPPPFVRGGESKPGLVMFIICRIRNLIWNFASLSSHFILFVCTKCNCSCSYSNTGNSICISPLQILRMQACLYPYQITLWKFK